MEMPQAIPDNEAMAQLMNVEVGFVMQRLPHSIGITMKTGSILATSYVPEHHFEELLAGLEAFRAELKDSRTYIRIARGEVLDTELFQCGVVGSWSISFDPGGSPYPVELMMINEFGGGFVMSFPTTRLNGVIDHFRTAIHEPPVAVA